MQSDEAPMADNHAFVFDGEYANEEFVAHQWKCMQCGLEIQYPAESMMDEDAGVEPSVDDDDVTVWAPDGVDLRIDEWRAMPCRDVEDLTLVARIMRS